MAMAMLPTTDPQIVCAMLIQLYQTALRQAHMTPPSWSMLSVMTGIEEGLANHSPDDPSGRAAIRNVHLRLMYALHDRSAQAGAQTILVQAWQFAPTRKTLLDRLPWVTPWLAQDPTLLPALLASFAWVDQQLAAMA